MTILEKQGPSTASYTDDSEGEDDHRDDEYGSEKRGYEEPGKPPSYADSVPAIASSSRGCSSRPAGTPPTNHTCISQTNSKISGHWNIDTNLQVPESLLKPLASGQTARPNLYLHTRNGSIHATVSLVAGTGQRANLQFESWDGKVAVALVSRLRSQPFKLKATTRNGELVMSLPLDFCGALKHHTRNGKVKFSEDMQSITSTFTDGISFVGDWQAAGFTDFTTWQGDEAEVETANGKIQFSYAETSKDVRDPPTHAGAAKLRGFFGRH